MDGGGGNGGYGRRDGQHGSAARGGGWVPPGAASSSGGGSGGGDPRMRGSQRGGDNGVGAGLASSAVPDYTAAAVRPASSGGPQLSAGGAAYPEARGMGSGAPRRTSEGAGSAGAGGGHRGGRDDYSRYSGAPAPAAGVAQVRHQHGGSAPGAGRRGGHGPASGRGQAGGGGGGHRASLSAGPGSSAKGATGVGGGAQSGGRRNSASSGGSGLSAMKSTQAESKKDNLMVKVGMVGDVQAGKTSLMVRYVEGNFDEDYIETLGVNFLEKTINLPRASVTFSVWDLGGAREFLTMLPIVCNDAVAILFVFDLTRKSTLSSIKEWYRQVRGLNKTAYSFLVGTKYDLFVKLSPQEQAAITKQARRFAKAMKAALIFTSASHGINVQKIYKLVFSKVFSVACKIPKKTTVGEPIIEY